MFEYLVLLHYTPRPGLHCNWALSLGRLNLHWHLNVEESSLRPLFEFLTAAPVDVDNFDLLADKSAWAGIAGMHFVLWTPLHP